MLTTQPDYDALLLALAAKHKELQGPCRIDHSGPNPNHPEQWWYHPACSLVGCPGYTPLAGPALLAGLLEVCSEVADAVFLYPPKNRVAKYVTGWTEGVWHARIIPLGSREQIEYGFPSNHHMDRDGEGPTPEAALTLATASASGLTGGA